MSRADVSSEAMRHYYRGRVFEATGELEIAIEEYKKAISSGADYADIRNSLGRVLAKKGFFEEARIEFEQALRLNPRYLEAQKNLNELLTKLSLLPIQKQQSKSALIEEHPAITSANNRPEAHAVPVSTKSSKPVLKYFVIPIGVSVVILISGIIGYKTFFVEQEPIQKVVNVDNQTISGLSKFKNKLILSDWTTQEIVFYKVTKDKITKSFIFKLDKNNIVPTSIVIDNKYLWILDGWGKKVYKYLLTETVPLLVKVLEIPDASPFAIARHKDYVLIADNSKHQIMVYDQDFKKVESVPFIVQDIVAMCSYFDKIWLLDKNASLYELKNYAQVKNTYQLNAISDKAISAFFVDDKYFWYSQEGESKIFYYTKNILK